MTTEKNTGEWIDPDDGLDWTETDFAIAAEYTGSKLVKPALAKRINPTGLNTSGIEPLDLRVLIKPDPVEEVTRGGIILAQQTVEQEKYATVRGTLIALGQNAFAEARQNPDFAPPDIGARVMIAKYGGVNVKGDDGSDYRIMNDADVVAVLHGGAK